MKAKKNILLISLVFAAIAVFSSYMGNAYAARPTTNEAGLAPLFYPSTPEKPRIQFLKTINGASFMDTNNSTYGDRFPGYTGTDGTQDINPLIKPYGMAVTRGQIFICDTAKQQVMVFDLAHNRVDVMKGLKRPLNIAIADDGTRFVTDGDYKKIMVYSPDNQYRWSYGNGSTKPVGITISEDRVFLTDMAAHQVVILNKNSGKELGRISSPGAAPGKIYAPTSLALDGQRNIYVTDTFNGRISKFSNDGKFLDTLGEVGINTGNFARPKGLAIDREGRIYVVDGSFENIQIFNAEKQLLLFFGDVGNVRGGINMPAQIVIDYDNVEYFNKYVAKGHEIEYLIFVSSTFGENKVNVYGFLKN
ncbi:MAG: hypothetical protein HYV97_19550 [Bdellovibrio sp.]|nr:hypothetical protein [Bdellovibrio sp.]